MFLSETKKDFVSLICCWKVGTCGPGMCHKHQIIRPLRRPVSQRCRSRSPNSNWNDRERSTCSDCVLCPCRDIFPNPPALTSLHSRRSLLCHSCIISTDVHSAYKYISKKKAKNKISYIDLYLLKLQLHQMLSLTHIHESLAPEQQLASGRHSVCTSSYGTIKSILRETEAIIYARFAKSWTGSQWFMFEFL